MCSKGPGDNIGYTSLTYPFANANIHASERQSLFSKM